MYKHKHSDFSDQWNIRLKFFKKGENKYTITSHNSSFD